MHSKEIKMNSNEKNQLLECVLFENALKTSVGGAIGAATGGLGGAITGTGVGAITAFLLKSPKELRKLANSTHDPKKKALLNKLAKDRESMSTKEYYSYYSRKGAKIGAILGSIIYGSAFALLAHQSK